jgi:predicted small lipoprotein YifL
VNLTRTLLVLTLLATLAGCGVKDVAAPVFDKVVGVYHVRVVDQYHATFDNQSDTRELWLDQKLLLRTRRGALLCHVALKPSAYGSAPKLIWNPSPDAECLYLNPANVTTRDFVIVSEALAKDTKAATSVFGGNLGAVVLGHEADFSKVFRYDDGSSILVAPDGQVYSRYKDDEDISVMDFAGKVLSDGKTIQIRSETYEVVNWEALPSYRDSSSRALTDVYTIKAAPTPTPKPHA